MHSLHSKFKPCPFKGGHKSILKKYHFCKKDIHFSEKNIILYVSVLFPLLPSKALLCVHSWSQVEFLALFCSHLLKKKKFGICSNISILQQSQTMYFLSHAEIEQTSIDANWMQSIIIISSICPAAKSQLLNK